MTDAGSEGTPAEGARDWRAELFPDGAPDVGITGLDVWRSTITRSDEAELDDAETEVKWHIYGLPTGEASDTLLLLGDLVGTGGGWFVGVTATCTLAFRHEAVFDSSDVDQVNSLATTLGGWCANILYDLASMRARSLIASSATCPLVVPLVTPEAHFASIRPATEGSEQET